MEVTTSGKVVIEFAPRDLAVLESLTKALNDFAEEMMLSRHGKRIECKPEDLPFQPDEVEAIKKEQAKVAAIKELEQEEPKVTLEAIQKLVVTLATTGKKAEARDIVKSYAERVTAIVPEHYNEVFAKLQALQG